jgi:hypothetical protein
MLEVGNGGMTEDEYRTHMHSSPPRLQLRV